MYLPRSISIQFPRNLKSEPLYESRAHFNLVLFHAKLRYKYNTKEEESQV